MKKKYLMQGKVGQTAFREDEMLNEVSNVRRNHTRLKEGAASIEQSG